MDVEVEVSPDSVRQGVEVGLYHVVILHAQQGRDVVITAGSPVERELEIKHRESNNTGVGRFEIS